MVFQSVPCDKESSSTEYNLTLFRAGRHTMGHVRYINILSRLRGFQDKLQHLGLFSLYPSLFWELRDKRNLTNLQF